MAMSIDDSSEHQRRSPRPSVQLRDRLPIHSPGTPGLYASLPRRVAGLLQYESASYSQGL